MKRRLACLLRRWAHRLDPPPDPVGLSVAGFYASSSASVASATMAQPYTFPAGWTWNGMEWVASPTPSKPHPPSLSVVR